jgi:lipopolysaccharide transport system ATP-binding protein
LGGTEAPSGVMYLPEKQKSESLGVNVISLCFKDEQGNILDTLLSGESAYFCVECAAHIKVENINIGILITALSGQNERVLYIASSSDNEFLEILPGKAEIQMQMPYCCLLPGLYSAKVYVKEGIRSFDIVESFRFLVRANKVISQSLFYQPRYWKVINK